MESNSLKVHWLGPGGTKTLCGRSAFKLPERGGGWGKWTYESRSGKTKFEAVPVWMRGPNIPVADCAICKARYLEEAVQ